MSKDNRLPVSTPPVLNRVSSVLSCTLLHLLQICPRDRANHPFSFRDILGWKLPNPRCIGDVDGGDGSNGGDYFDYSMVLMQCSDDWIRAGVFLC